MIFPSQVFVLKPSELLLQNFQGCITCGNFKGNMRIYCSTCVHPNLFAPSHAKLTRESRARVLIKKDLRRLAPFFAVLQVFVLQHKKTLSHRKNCASKHYSCVHRNTIVFTLPVDNYCLSKIVMRRTLTEPSTTL